MKLYYKLLEKIKNNKTRVKNGISIIIFAVGLRYRNRRINSIPNNLLSNSTRQVKQVHNYVEEEMQVINTKNAKSFKTGSGVLKYTLEIRSGSIEGAEGFGINPPMSRPSYSQFLTSQTFGTKTSLDNDSPDSDHSDSDTSSSSYSNFEYLDETLSNVDSSSVIG